MFSGSRLKECRMEKQYSQSELANLLKINRASYNKWEAGKSVPNQKNLATLARILDVPTTYFESEYKIVNTYLQLSSENQDKVDEYAEGLLQTQQSIDKIVPLFAVEVLSDVSLSAGPGESLFDEYETETVYALSWNDSVYIKKLYREWYHSTIATLINGFLMKIILEL